MLDVKVKQLKNRTAEKEKESRKVEKKEKSKRLYVIHAYMDINARESTWIIVELLS